MAASTARVIAVANQKGGVGKSTTAVSLGASLAELGKKVLVVDLDPQGNASTGLGIRHEARDVTVYDVLAAEAAIEGAIVPTPIEGLYAIPSTIDLAGAEIELVSQFSRELRLRKALEPLKKGKDRYDFILLDCPPSLGLLTVNALAAAEELIVPIQTEYYALEGLGQLLRNVKLVQHNVNPNLRLTGIVMTMYDPRTKLSEQVVQEVRRFFGDRVYDTIIPRTVRLSEAPGFGQPITVYDPKSRGAQCYRDLAKEVVEKLPPKEPLPMVDDLPRVVVPPPEEQQPPTPARARRPLVRADEPEARADDESPAVGPAANGVSVAATRSDPNGEVEEPSVAEELVDPAEPPAGANGHARVEAVGPAAAGDDADSEAGGARAEADVETSIDTDPGSQTIGNRPGMLGEPDVEGATAAPGPAPGSEGSTATPSVPAPRHEAGRVVLAEEESVEAEPYQMPKPDDEGEGKRRRWFRRGGDR